MRSFNRDSLVPDADDEVQPTHIAAYEWQSVLFRVAIRVVARAPAAPFRLNSALDTLRGNGKYRVDLKRLSHRMGAVVEIASSRPMAERF